MSNALSLAVFLARAGVGSRRVCDDLVRSGVVAVNGEVVDFPRFKVGAEDVVTVEGEPVALKALRYVLVNKPRGVASTRRDPHAERVIVDIVPEGRALFPVGRLDVDTTGLIILTNDGILANHLMHPRYGVPKTYVARVRGKVSRRALAMLRQGLELDDGMTSPAEVALKKQSAKTALVEITIHEGRKRQVRRMFAAVGLPVEELHRRRYGPLTDKGLEPGGSRDLSDDEVEALRRAGEDVVRMNSRELEGEPVFLAGEGGVLATEVEVVVTVSDAMEAEAARANEAPAQVQAEPETEALATGGEEAWVEPEAEPQAEASPEPEDAETSSAELEVQGSAEPEAQSPAEAEAEGSAPPEAPDPVEPEAPGGGRPEDSDG